MLPSGIFIDCQPIFGTAEGTELTGSALRTSIAGNARRTSTTGNARRTSTAGGSTCRTSTGVEFEVLGCLLSESRASKNTTPTLANSHQIHEPLRRDSRCTGSAMGGTAASPAGGGVGIAGRIGRRFFDRGKFPLSSARISGGSSLSKESSNRLPFRPSFRLSFRSSFRHDCQSSWFGYVRVRLSAGNVLTALSYSLPELPFNERIYEKLWLLWALPRSG
jgi:hypothetical protein